MLVQFGGGIFNAGHAGWGGKTDRASAGGTHRQKNLWWGGKCLEGQGGAVVFLVAVLIRQEGIESPSYHLGDEGWG